MIQTNI